MFIMVSVCWATSKLLVPSAPLGKGIGRAWSTWVFCHASQELRNEGSNSTLLSMLRRAERRGSAKSFSMARIAPGHSQPVRIELRGHTCIHNALSLVAGDAWQSEYNDPDSMSCKRGTFNTLPHYVCLCVVMLQSLEVPLLHLGRAVWRWLE